MAANPSYDVLVVGGGASGLAAALASARAGARTAVLERDVACGLPILATGNGRCNCSNEHLETSRYAHPDGAAAVMGPRPEERVDEFLRSVGVATTSIDGRLYPYSRRAESVRDALVGACGREGVDLIEAAALQGADHGGAAASWRVSYRTPARPLAVKRHADFRKRLRALRKALAEAPVVTRSLTAGSIVLASGGRAEGVCRLFDLPHLPERPVLCPVACHPAPEWGARADVLERLDGLRVDARVSLLDAQGLPAWRESGEVLFRPWGLSGMVVFDLSRRARPGARIELDLFPHLGAEELRELLWDRQAALDPRGASPRSKVSPASVMDALAARGARWFDGLLAPALSGALWPALSKDPAVGRVAHALQHLPFLVDGLAEIGTAQVTRGGVPLSAVDLPTLRVTAAGGARLYACGELLDMDADCGGFNLAWAWLSGLAAGRSAALGR